MPVVHSMAQQCVSGPRTDLVLRPGDPSSAPRLPYFPPRWPCRLHIMTFAQLALSQLALWGVWSAVESVGVNLLLKFLYENPISALQLKRPPSRTLAAESHRIAARMMIALAYFVYACWQVWQATEPSAYKKFGVSVFASDKDIKRHFRDLAKMFHPDKVGAAGEVKFLQLHQIYEILTEPTLRFAYDRYAIFLTLDLALRPLPGRNSARPVNLFAKACSRFCIRSFISYLHRHLRGCCISKAIPIHLVLEPWYVRPIYPSGACYCRPRYS